MTRARYITPGATAARLENIRRLVAALQVSELRRDEMGELLKVGPSGVRKYLTDLRGKVTLVGVGSEQVCRLSLSAVETQQYLSTLAAEALARPAKKTTSRIDVSSVGRHFHILADDTYHAIRVSRAPAMRDPLVAAFFGAARAVEVRV